MIDLSVKEEIDIEDELKLRYRDVEEFKKISIETIEFFKYMVKDTGVRLHMPDVISMTMKEFKALYDDIYGTYFMKHFGNMLYSNEEKEEDWMEM